MVRDIAAFIIVYVLFVFYCACVWQGIQREIETNEKEYIVERLERVCK